MWISGRLLAGALVLCAAACTSGRAPTSEPPARSTTPSAGTSDAGSPAPTTTAPATTAPATTAPATSAPGTTAPATTAPGTAETIEPIRVYADCRTPTVRPTTIVLTCADGGASITAIAWSRWDATRAVGTGTLRYNDCKPNCAQGTFRTTPTTVTLTAPVDLGEGLIVWSRVRDGTNTVRSLTLGTG